MLLLLLNVRSFLHDLIVLLLGLNVDISASNVLVDFPANFVARCVLSGVLIDHFALVGLTAHLTSGTLLVDFLDRG